MAVYARGGEPVVVELFSSQGCSSCPPAEQLMVDLHKEFGDRIIPLVFHVTYWDDLGWADPFAHSLFTERQRAYAKIFGRETVYTPQMVIQGESEFAGSNAARARREIRSRSHRPQSQIVLSVEHLGQTTLRMKAKIPAHIEDNGGNVYGVVYENAPPVAVLRGENKGRTMRGDFAVRVLATLQKGQAGDWVSDIHLHPSWHKDNLEAAVWVQDAAARIVAAVRQKDL